MRYLALLFLLLASNSFATSKDYLLVLSSQRNAETLAEAGRLFTLQHPELKIVARSDSQVSEMDDEQLVTLIRGSRGIIGMGLYGASVSRLSTILDATPRPKLFVSSDHRLIQLTKLRGQRLFPEKEVLQLLAKYRFSDKFDEELSALKQKYPQQSLWIMAKAYWHAGEVENSKSMFQWYFNLLGENTPVIAPEPMPKVRWFSKDQLHKQFPEIDSQNTPKSKVFIIDHAGGGRPADLRLLRDLCQKIEQQLESECLAALAYWGEAGVSAVSDIQQLKDQISAVVMLQDFVIGGGEGRAAVTELLKNLNVPMLKAIKLRDRSAQERILSSDGLAQEKVYYQVAMPELQGASQPLVIATAGAPHEDEFTGIRVQGVEKEPNGLQSLVKRLKGWQRLQQKDNAEKRLAIVYYNHPPGRHNIGADNLDVPASLWHILSELKKAGYKTGRLPESQETLLDLMQQKGVNLPNDQDALKSMSGNIHKMSSETYREWFNKLPRSVQQEMTWGPFGLLHSQLQQALASDKPDLAHDVLEHVMEEMHHLLEGVDHPARKRALLLIQQLEMRYQKAIESGDPKLMTEGLEITKALTRTGIEGLAGWGEIPGKVMTFDNQLLLPGIQFGNVFIGPQPPRGWEINEELLHANLAFPPPHQYLAFYHFLQNEFKADALVHLGRHSTYEFLPRRSVGVAHDDYSTILAGDLPGIYPYIVDGVGEGIQAKRRGLAVMVDHLTPPLASTPLYDELLQLRQMVESFEASHASGNEAVAKRLVNNIREKLDSLDLKEEIAEAISAELAIMGISFDEVDDDMLVHEVGHYLTDLQERFMPLGLHVFGSDWGQDAVELMLNSMQSKPASSPYRTIEDDKENQAEHWRDLLKASPKAEMNALLRGLDGGYISPGHGNDPIRSPESLPTGRNFYALSSNLIPSKVAWEIGQEMARSARQENSQRAEKREAIILWASDVVRDEGVMIAFGLDMLGLEPVWNSRGLVKGLKQQESAFNVQGSHSPKIRRDVVFTTSGLFRDLYGQQMKLLNQATLMALDASKTLIIRDYPALALALEEALAPLGPLSKGGEEPLTSNQVAAHWIAQAQELLAQNIPAVDAGVMASYRVFGDAPGSYGAGINRLVERSGAWDNRAELASVFMRRLGHSYGVETYGEPAQAAFQRVLADVENTYLGRASNLYGLLDNNDAFDYLGGLSLAVETASGSAPQNFVMDHADPTNIKTRPLGRALRQELRGRFLNPKWLEELMEHGYAGARTMGSEFLEYLWGWQVTNPTLVGDWAWQEVKSVYIDDKHQLGLDRFLEEGHNAHVKSNMLAIMLVAIHKDFWQASQEDTQQLAQAFYELVQQNGLPGSGHTDPDHPMLPWLADYLTEEQWQKLEKIIEDARGEPEVEQSETFERIAEVSLEQDESQSGQTQGSQSQSLSAYWLWALFILLAIFVGFGVYHGVVISQRIQQQSKKDL